MNRTFLALACATALLAGCSSDSSGTPATNSPATNSPAPNSPAPITTATNTPATNSPPPRSGVTLVTYDSFPTKDTGLNAALDEFTASTGIEVRIVTAGDAGTMVTKAALTAGNPEGDVMFGVDNTLLPTARGANVFTPYTPAGAEEVPGDLRALAPDGSLTPVDHGEVCINYDIAAMAQRGLDPPTTLDDLRHATYRDLLVVENPASSSPGFAFLLATIARYGDGWQQYWKDLRTNGVEVVDSWDSAYYERFSGSAGSTGDRPLVVSYATSPPAEVIFADPPVSAAPTAVMTDSCFQQVEFAGLLRGAENPAGGQALLDFLVSDRFQRELPLGLFVYPARRGVALPDEFTRYAAMPEEVLTIPPDEIEAERTAWQDEWTQIVLS